MSRASGSDLASGSSLVTTVDDLLSTLAVEAPIHHLT
jgi:hypothetical protein